MKEWILKIAIVIVMINALGQLAMSQIHILATTKIFANEIGFYLFLFIIFGLTTAFNVFLIDRRRGKIFFALSCWVAIAFALIYLNIMQTDVAAQETLTMEDMRATVTLMLIAIGVLLVSSLVIPLLSWNDVKPAEVG